MYNKTYIKTSGSAFLVFYTAFIISGILHYHHYEFYTELSVKTETSENKANDLDPDFYKICSLHQFSQSVAHFHYSSSDINQRLSLSDTDLSDRLVNKISFEKISKKSPRAPPVLS